MKTTLESKCIHELLLQTGNREEEGKIMKIGNCYDCSSEMVITDTYHHVSSDVYVLIQKKEVNARECRE